MTVYSVQNPPSGLGDPVFVRDNASPDARGRFTNGIQHNILDPWILVTGHNDGGLHTDGALWARPISVPPGAPQDVAMAPTGPDPLPGTSISNPYDGGDAPKVAGAALDNAFKGWMDAFPVEAEQQDLLANYSHGLVQFWRLTDQPEEARDPVTHPGTGIVIDPPGTSDLPYIVLPHAGTCAWRLDSAVITTPNPPSPPVVEAFLFVADFGGHLYLYDITDLPASGRGNLGAPALTYTSPPGHVDGQPLNVRALVVDQIENLNILVYVGVASYGIEVIHMFRTSLNAPWNLAVKERIETPGTVHDLAIRPAAPGQPKLLLVADGPAGLRIFGEEQ